MTNVPWTAPATLWSRLQMEGGRPKEQAISNGFDLNGAVYFAMGGSNGPLDNLVIKLDDGSTEFVGHEIANLARTDGRPEHTR